MGKSHSSAAQHKSYMLKVPNSTLSISRQPEKEISCLRCQHSAANQGTQYRARGTNGLAQHKGFLHVHIHSYGQPCVGWHPVIHKCLPKSSHMSMLNSESSSLMEFYHLNELGRLLFCKHLPPGIFLHVEILNDREKVSLRAAPGSLSL